MNPPTRVSMGVLLVSDPPTVPPAEKPKCEIGLSGIAGSGSRGETQALFGTGYMTVFSTARRPFEPRPTKNDASRKWRSSDPGKRRTRVRVGRADLHGSSWNTAPG